MLYTGEKTYSKTSKFGLYKYNQYEDNIRNQKRKNKKIIKTIFVAFCILIGVSSLSLSIYYFSSELKTKNPIKLPKNVTQKVAVNITKNSSIETATALPFFSSIFSNYFDDSKSYNRKIINYSNNSDKLALKGTINKFEKSPYQFDKSYKNLQDLLNLYNGQGNEGILEYKGIKFKGVIRNPETDLQGSGSDIYKNIVSQERPPLDPFYRYKPQTPGDINMMAPSFRFSPVLPNQKKIDKDLIRPISLMLDIYPMAQDESQIDKNSIISLLTKPLLHNSVPISQKIAKINSNTQKVTTPFPYEIISAKPKIEKSSKENTPNQMVVHLNLFQNKKPIRGHKKRGGKHSFFKVNPGFVVTDSGTRNKQKIREYNLLLNEEYQDYEDNYDDYYDMMPRMDNGDTKITKTSNSFEEDDLKMEPRLHEEKETKQSEDVWDPTLNKSPKMDHTILDKNISTVKNKNFYKTDYAHRDMHYGVKENLLTKLSESPINITTKPFSIFSPSPLNKMVAQNVRLGVSRNINLFDISKVTKITPKVSLSITPPQILHNKYLTTPITPLHWDLNRLKDIQVVQNHKMENSF